MKALLNKFLFSIPTQISIIHLSASTITILSYISVIVSASLFLVGIYMIYKRKKHSIRILCLSFLLLINPMINLILN
ncbi:hypothetical protein UT300019_33820 [Clostridium sp. CTA-19]